MAARITVLDFRRPRPRARITRYSDIRSPFIFVVSCRCGYSAKVNEEDAARERKRAHDAAHRRAEAAHPAGKARRGATPGGAA